MLDRFEYFSVIGALTFEDGCAIVEGMGEVMHFGVAPGEHFSVHPYEAVAIVVGYAYHCLFLPLHLFVVLRKIIYKNTVMVKEDNKNLSFEAWPHVLIVDDDARICALLERYLRENGFVAVTAANAAEAREVLGLFEFDVLVVDVMMPGQSGVDFTRDLRAETDLPVLLLTALGQGEDKIKGLEAGADDYLVKPFEPLELLLRLKTILRRYAAPVYASDQLVFQIGKWVYRSEYDELRCGDKSVSLTSAEVVLIQALAAYKGQVADREALAKRCGVDADSRSIDVQVTRLRRKIEDDTKNPRYLRTVRGKGYVLNVQEIS